MYDIYKDRVNNPYRIYIDAGLKMSIIVENSNNLEVWKTKATQHMDMFKRMRQLFGYLWTLVLLVKDLPPYTVKNQCYILNGFITCINDKTFTF